MLRVNLVISSVLSFLVITTALAGEKLVATGLHDKDGRTTLGVSIIGVGSSRPGVQRFLVALPADAASRVRDGCRAVKNDQANYRERLVKFCRALPEKTRVAAWN